MTSSIMCRARLFAQKHPKLAAQILQPPPFDDRSLLQRCKSSYPTSLEGYLECRKWSTIVDDSDQCHDAAALTLISQTLTYPLTLAQFVRDVSTVRNAKGSLENNPMKILILGARAEAALPLVYWKEFLFSSVMFRNNNDDGGYNSSLYSNNQHFELTFLGPEMYVQKNSNFIELQYQDKESEESSVPQSSHQLRLKYKRGIFDEENILQRLSMIDAFVLFNPGIGHPSLSDGWLSTIKGVLKSRKPVLLTAHSDIDQERDRLTITNLMQDGSNHKEIQYLENQWSSRLVNNDPLEGNNGVMANKYKLCVM